jgi:hypothetical protein
MYRQLDLQFCLGILFCIALTMLQTNEQVQNCFFLAILFLSNLY